MRSPRKALVWSLALLTVLALAASGGARAAQNRPSWTTGDTWTYTATEGSTTITTVQTVAERTSVAIGTRTYGVWHVITTDTAVFGGTSITVTEESWVQDEDLGVAKTVTDVLIVGEVTTTYDPPKSGAAFPLSSGKTWQGDTTQRIVSSIANLTFSVSYTGSVIDERSVTVPAGTFSAAAIRSPSSGNDYTVTWYSEAVGNAVLIEDYTGGNLDSSRALTSYKYAAGAFGLILIVAGVLVIAAVAVAALALARRRRRARMPPGGYPPMPPQAPPGPPPGT